jgi:hypothetical protein
MYLLFVSPCSPQAAWGNAELTCARTFGPRGPSAVPYSFRHFPKGLECPGANPLKGAHAALDTAVLTAYGFSAKRDLLAQLLALNQEVATNIEKGEPVAAPSVPENYANPKKLVTENCIRPAATGG